MIVPASGLARQPTTAPRACVGLLDSDLPDALNRLLLAGRDFRGRGWFDVDRGATPWLRLLATCLRLPRRGRGIPVRLDVRVDDSAECWDRRFAGRRLRTRQHAAGGRLIESIGPIELSFVLRRQGDVVLFTGGRAALRLGRLAVTLPRRLRPVVRATLRPVGRDQLRVWVRISMPGGGTLLSYAGDLEVLP